MKIDITKHDLLTIIKSSREKWEDREIEELKAALDALKLSPVEPPKPKVERPRNLAFDLIAEVCGFTEITPSVGSRIQRCLNEMRAATPGAALSVLRGRIDEYKRRFPECPVTPEALAKHYCSLGTANTQQFQQSLPDNVKKMLKEQAEKGINSGVSA